MVEYLCFAAVGFYKFLATSPKVTTHNVAELVRKKKKPKNNQGRRPKNKNNKNNKANKKEQCNMDNPQRAW